MGRSRNIFRRSSRTRRIASGGPVKRYLRLKTPGGWGWLTNPNRAGSRRGHGRTSIGCAIVPLLFLACLAGLAAGFP